MGVNEGLARRAEFRGPAAITAVVAGCALLVLTGCGRKGQFYTPRTMPVELQTPKAENARTLDLSKLATYTMSTELIDRGDVVNIAVSAGHGAEKVEVMPVRVGDDGVANIPIVGRVQLAGIELQAAEQMIAAAAVERGLYRNPTVTVTMNQRRTNNITVVGAVEKPGVYQIPRGASTLLAAIVRADGLSEDAGTMVEVRRPVRTNPAAGPVEQDRMAGGTQLTSYAQASPVANGTGVAAQPVSFKIDLVAAARDGHDGQFLQDGDVVMVERRDPQPVHVIGLVSKPGQFELPPSQDLHVLDVLAMAGGVSLNVADKVHLIRKLPDQQAPAVVEISLKEAKSTGAGNLRLAPGDVVSVEDTPVTVVVDTIRTFFRVGFTSAMPGL